MTESAETMAIALWWAKRGKNYLAAGEQDSRRMRMAWSEAGPEQRDEIRDELIAAQQVYIFKWLSSSGRLVSNLRAIVYTWVLTQ